MKFLYAIIAAMLMTSCTVNNYTVPSPSAPSQPGAKLIPAKDTKSVSTSVATECSVTAPLTAEAFAALNEGARVEYLVKYSVELANALGDCRDFAMRISGGT